MSYDELSEIINKRGDKISGLLPANWIHLEGNFSPTELRQIAKVISDNFKMIQNGNTK